VIWFYSTINGALDFPHSAFFSLLLFCLPFTLFGWQLFKKRRESWKGNYAVVSLLLLLVVLPPVAAFGASRLLPQSLWGARHLMFVPVFYLLLESIAVFSIQPRWLSTSLVILLVAWSTFVCEQYLRTSKPKLSWDSFVQTLLQNESEHTLVRVYALEPYVFVPLQYYINAMARDRFEARLVSDQAAMEGDHFWIAIRIKGLGKVKPPQELFYKPGYKLGNPTLLKTDSYAVVLFPAWRTSTTNLRADR
jgi:hypothetical protein